MHTSGLIHQLESTTLPIVVTKFIHFFAGRGESPGFRGRGDSSERTGHPWGLPQPAGNTWLFSTCISHHSYTNLNPHFKYLSPNSFTFFAGCGESPGFKGWGNSSERTRHPWGLPQGTGNIWFISPCIHQDWYTNLNQPHFKYLSPNSFTFFAGRGESPGFRGWGDSSETCGPPETEMRASVWSPKTRESS